MTEETGRNKLGIAQDCLALPVILPDSEHRSFHCMCWSPCCLYFRHLVNSPAVLLFRGQFWVHGFWFIDSSLYHTALIALIGLYVSIGLFIFEVRF